MKIDLSKLCVYVRIRSFIRSLSYACDLYAVNAFSTHNRLQSINMQNKDL